MYIWITYLNKAGVLQDKRSR